MSLVVQKFGGSSVGSIDRIEHVAQRVAKRARQGTSLVVVVSAMRGETDRLLGLVQEITEDPSLRETDQLVATGEQVSAALLAIALNKQGIPARSMTGPQMRLRTDGRFSRARIKTLDHTVIMSALDAGEVVVAAGFQGIDEDDNITTLGRGGSDTSAVAMAAALGADECEIYTDVLGVYTADPNICPDAIKLDEIAFDEMMEMASQGSKVLQIRSVELAMNHQVPLRVRSTFSDDPGTLVRAEDGEGDDDSIERLVVRGISHNKNEVKITLRQVPDQPGIAAAIFASLAEQHINVDVIVQNTSAAGTTDLSFTVERPDRHRAEELVLDVATRIGAGGVEIDPDIAKVSIVGVGMRSHAGVAASMFQTLQAVNVNIQMITTSEIKVTCVISLNDVTAAVRSLHTAFNLAAGGQVASPPAKASKSKARKSAKAPAKAGGSRKKAASSIRSAAAKKKSTTKRAAVKKKSTVKRAAAKKKSTVKRTAVKKKSTAKRTAVKKKSTAKRTAVKKKSTTKRAAVKKKSTAKRTAVKKTTSRARA